MSEKIIRNAAVCFVAPEFYPGQEFNELELQAKIFEQIQKFYDAGIRQFLTGCQPGFDLICANTVRIIHEALDIPKLQVITVLTSEEQFRTYDTYHENLAVDMLTQCDDPIFLNRVEFKGETLLQRDYLLEHSSRMLTYYDPQNPDEDFMEFIIKASQELHTIVNLW